jgi:hypothetical protein
MINTTSGGMTYRHSMTAYWTIFFIKIIIPFKKYHFYQIKIAKMFCFYKSHQRMLFEKFSKSGAKFTLSES